MTAQPEAGIHLIPLADGHWSVWREALLRSAGFPVTGLAMLSSARCARVADEHLTGAVQRDQFDEVFVQAAKRNSADIYRICADPLFREAVTWQNLSALISVNKILAAGTEPRRNARHRDRERMVTRYWQRYCGKAETIGFFGPLCWARLDRTEPTVSARAGADIIRSRHVYFDYWPLAALARTLSGDPAIRAWLSPALAPQLTLQDREVIDSVRPPLRLTRAQAAVVSRCDGRRSAWRIAREAVAEPAAGLRSAEDVYLLLEGLVHRGILHWDFDLPVTLDAERVLRERIEGIADHGVRAAAASKLAALSAGRCEVASSAGDPDRLAAALQGLDSTFTALTGQPATRRSGENYAGRTLCAEETTRDLDVTFGRAVFDAIAAPLAIPLTVARWICRAMARAYAAEFERLYAELTADLGSSEVPLGQLWFAAQNSFYGTALRPADRVLADMGERWSQLLGLDPARRAKPRLAFSSTTLGTRLGELFPSGEGAWPAARIHSLDLQFGARSMDAFANGAFSVVISELHTAWAALGCGASVASHPGPEGMRQALRRDMAGRAIYPLLPPDWPRHTPRLAFALESPQDVQLGFAPAPGAQRQRLVPISSVVVRRSGNGLIGAAKDGRRWSLLDIFGRPLSELTVDAFKVIWTGAHVPRVTIDNLVVGRERWRMTVAGCPIASARGEAEEYLAVRRWKAALGLPEEVFVKLSSEGKPLFADLTSPVYASTLAAALRAARRKHGETASLVVTEMLPAPDEAWVADADGRRYISELRLHVRDDLAVDAESGEPR